MDCIGFLIHLVHVIMERMKDVLLKADKHLKFGNETKTMSEIIRDKDCTAFCLLTDEIIACISNATEPDLNDAKCLLENIRRRKLYNFIGETRITFDQEQDKDFEERINELKNGSTDLEVLRFKLDYGKKKENPVDSVMFYSKKDTDKAIKIRKEEVSYLIPEHMYEKHVLLIYKGNGFKKDEERLKTNFRDWCTKYKYPIIKESNDESGL